jgi:cation:H+ antiporter
LNIHTDKKKKDKADVGRKNKLSLSKPLSLLIGGFVLLILGGKAAEVGAVAGARILGISEMFIGVTIVAIATSLPELITTIIAAKRDEADLIWGNIVGSNLFNILFVLPITLIVASAVTGNIIKIPMGSYEPWFYMIVMLLVTLRAWKAMRKDEDINNIEGYSLVGIYTAFLITATIWKSVG